MYIRHTSANGQDLGCYHSIKHASERLQYDVALLSIVVKHKTTLNDGSILRRCKETSRAIKTKRALIFKALQEYIATNNDARIIARKYDLKLTDVSRAIARHVKEKAIHFAYMDWLSNQGPIDKTAAKYDISGWSLSARIKRGLRA